MYIKPASTGKNRYCFLLVLVLLIASCRDPVNVDNDKNKNNQVDDSGYQNPNAGVARDIAFSRESGLYSQSFSLTLAAPLGSTIYYSTDGSIPLPGKVGNGFVFKYSSPIAVQDRSGQANILATQENTLQMYAKDNDQWTGSVPSNYVPSKDQVPKATVIRALAVNSAGSQSAVITKTYFIGNNLADYANHRVISIVTDPYNLVDQDYGILVRGDPGNVWAGTSSGADLTNAYNFQQKGREWEREAFLEIFEGSPNSRTVTLSTGVGIRTRGGYSRGAAQKSFNVYFREEYGLNNLRNYDLIPGAVKADGKTPVERYKNFLLRNGGNDYQSTKFYDVFIQDLVRDRDFSTQAAVPCIVYLNGEYWGPYNLQEKYGDSHTEYKYGVNRANVISYEIGELDDGLPGEENLYRDMITYATAPGTDMSDDTTYDNFFGTYFDSSNFFDYWAAQIFVNNEDWPHSNYRLWRTRDVEPGNPYGDTKWRWQMFDLDWALGVNSDGSTLGAHGVDAFDQILNGSNNTASNNRLFKALLVNEKFCRQLVNTIMDLYNVNFLSSSYLPKFNYYKAVYKPLMDGYFERWGYPDQDDHDDIYSGWDSVFEDQTGWMEDYLRDIRNTMVNTYLPKYFGSGYVGIANIGIAASGLYDVTVSATGVSGALVKISTITPNLGSGTWTGTYYAGNPIPITAGTVPGYVFDGWTVTGGSAADPSARTTTVTITGNAQITAKYRSQ